MEAPVLARQDFSKVFTIHADASQSAIGSVLTQEDDNGEEHPFVYISRVLTPAERNYSTTDREMLAILYAIRKIRCYVEEHQFIIKTFHMALKYIQSIKELTGRLARWILELQEYDFEIHYKKGSLQVVADALSRNIILGNDEIVAFEEVKNTWYNRRIEEVLRNAKKFSD